MSVRAYDYSRLIDPAAPPIAVDVLVVPRDCPPERVSDILGEVVGDGSSPVQLVVGDEPVGVVTVEVLAPLLLDRYENARGGPAVVGAGPLRWYRCRACGATGWSVAGIPRCPNGPGNHGTMAAY